MNRQARRLCEVATEISRQGAWRDRTLDPEGLVPASVWAAVGRSLALDEMESTAREALSYDSLADEAGRKLSDIARECAALDGIVVNLQQVLAAAQRVDAQRAEAERERRLAERNRQIAEQRRLREQQLGERLTGSRGAAADPTETETYADRTAGLAAESEAVAGFLAEIDRLLHDSE